ncbi:MAG: tyrosine-type recombinase/integrase, partial [Chloroflexota bacterium]|nr:tyrosine-type recombinase/integrase [Chloroflexota bacterium]
MRQIISSQHHRPPNYLIGGREGDPLLLQEWLLVLRGDGKSPRTIEGYADSVRQLASFLREGGFPSLTQATAEHLREWFNALRERGNKPATVNTRYRGVHAFYKWLLKEGEVRENPLTRIEPPQVPETVQPYYKPEELQLVLKSLRGRRLRGIDAARSRAILLVLFDTGLRASELCALRVEDVDWEAQTIVIREAKGGSQRTVSLGTTAMRSVMSYLRLRAMDSQWLLATLDGNRLTKNALKLALCRAFDAAGVQFKGIHAFRR